MSQSERVFGEGETKLKNLLINLLHRRRRSSCAGRRVANTPKLCGEVPLVAGVGGRDDLDVCATFGIATHRCVYDDAADVWMVDSCPCRSVA